MNHVFACRLIVMTTCAASHGVAVAQEDAVTRFVLVNADSDADIGPLNDGDTIYMGLLDTANLNVRAVTTPATVGSVRFALDGNANFRTESVAPYALAGDSGGNYNPWTPAFGAHVLTATPFTGSGAGGTAGAGLTVRFTVEAGDPGLPVVDAGDDAVVILPGASVELTGSATDDGVVNSTVWTQRSGPNTAGLAGAGTLHLTASGMVQGSYVFRLTVTDDENHVAWDEVRVAVVPEGIGDAVIDGELKEWHKVTLSFNGPATSENATPNPFTDYRLNVVFHHPASGKSLLVPGYYAADGDAANTGASSGNVWKAHLAPEEPGMWTYAASFRTGAGVAMDDAPAAGAPAGYFDGATGSFEVAPTDKSGRDFRGKGRLDYVGRHHLRHAGTGEYFMKCGTDAPENFLAYEDFDGGFKSDGIEDGRIKTWSAHLGDWQRGDPVWQGTRGKAIIGAVNYLASKGLNAFSFLTLNINGDDRNVFPYTTYSERYRMDCSRLDQWGVVFDHGTRMGMYLHFKTSETENEMLLDNGNTGSQRKLYYRELIARYAHNLGLNWNLGEENGALGDSNQSTAQRKAMARYFHDHDPYGHNIVIHNGRAPDDLLGDASWLTGFSLQTNNAAFVNVFAKTREYVDKSADAKRPWVVACDEPGDAQHALRPAGDSGNSWEDGRKNALWGNVMAGGAGVEFYFGYAHDHSDLTCEDYRSRDGFWDYGRNMLEFFANFGVPFQDMRNENALSSNSNSWCLRKPGESYVVYLKNGGTTNLDLGGASGEFTVRWYDPRHGGGLQTGAVAAVSGGGGRSLGTAPSATGSDWVVLVARDMPGFQNLFPGLDPDGDANRNGLSNYFDYASGFDPVLATVPEAGSFLAGPEIYAHPIRTGAEDVFVAYETSVDLEHDIWMPLVENTHYTLDLADPGYPRVRLDESVISSGLTRFFRHRFTNVAP